jgi:hypothetical protein
MTASAQDRPREKVCTAHPTKFADKGWTRQDPAAILHGLSGYKVDRRKHRVTAWHIKKDKVLPGTDETATPTIGV